MLKAAFIFIAPQANSKQHQAVITTPQVELTIVGVSDYQSAAIAAKELIEQGIAAIELCGGFGHEGVAAVKKTVNNKAAVGVVRFDIHPGLENKSGDELF